MTTAIELGKAFGTIVAVTIAAWVAWLIRRQEQLKEAWVNWGAALYHLVLVLDEAEPPSFVGGVTNPQWLEWHKRDQAAHADIRIALFALQMKERDRNLRWYLTIAMFHVVKKEDREKAQEMVRVVIRCLSASDAVFWSLRPTFTKLPSELEMLSGPVPDDFEP